MFPKTYKAIRSNKGGSGGLREAWPSGVATLEKGTFWCFLFIFKLEDKKRQVSGSGVLNCTSNGNQNFRKQGTLLMKYLYSMAKICSTSKSLNDYLLNELNEWTNK